MERLGKGVKQFKINNEDTTTFSMTSIWQLYCQLRAYVGSFSSGSIVDFGWVNVLGGVSLRGGVIGAWVGLVRPCFWVGIAWLAFSRRGSLAWCLRWGELRQCGVFPLRPPHCVVVALRVRGVGGRQSIIVLSL